jgi:hypothetical protein
MGRTRRLGMDIGPSEAENLLDGLPAQADTTGFGGVKLVISDAHEGFKAPSRRW